MVTDAAAPLSSCSRSMRWHREAHAASALHRCSDVLCGAGSVLKGQPGCSPGVGERRPMIRHVVMFCWIPEATEEQKQQVAAELRRLPALLPVLRAYHVDPISA